MPEMFGPYQVEAQVAVGSTGRVYRARHVELGRLAAIKELAAAVLGVPGQIERLRAEASLLAALSHPNIVALYDYVEEPHRAWLAEQWVEGASLEAILSAHGRLTPEQALGVVRGAVTGLAYAHDRGLVHRDVSAANVLADMAGTSMLVDFGLAAPAGAGAAVGTPAFLSPEAARGDAVGKPGDVYSAAAVLYLLLAGRPVFAGSSAADMVRRHVEEPAPRLGTQGADLEDLLARSLSKDPGQRPPDAGAFLVELEAAAARRFGAGWLERASIVGLVGSALAGGLAAVGGGAAGGVAETVVVDAGMRNLAPATAKVTRKAGTKFALVVGGAIVIAAIGGTAAVLANSGNDSPSSDPTQGVSSIGQSPTPTPTIDPVTDTDPQGKWDFRSVITKTTDPGWATVGKKDHSVWTFKADCAQAVSCGGVIQSSSGVPKDYTWNGRVLQITREDSKQYQSYCVRVDTGAKIPGSKVWFTYHYKVEKLKVVGQGPDGPTKLQGSSVTTTTFDRWNSQCDLVKSSQKPIKVTSLDTLTVQN